MRITKFKLTAKASYLCGVLLLVVTNICSSHIYASPGFAYDLKPWSAMFYRGNTAEQIFGDVLAGKYNSYGEEIYVAELAYTLNPDNIVRRIFQPAFTTIQLAGSIAYRHDYAHQDNVKEGDLYVVWRWTKFPWENYLKNSIAIGDGVSYVSHPPFADREKEKPASDYSRLLNYLMMEATFALPAHPQFELAFRVYHRCTAWGTFAKNANAGSTGIGVGIRYYFSL